MTKGKRPAHINKAMKELRSYARSEMAKTEIVQFRVDQSDFERLVEAASQLEMPMGAMVRQWVIANLNKPLPSKKSNSQLIVAETTSSWSPSNSPGRAAHNIDDINQVKAELSRLRKRMDKLESRQTDK